MWGYSPFGHVGVGEESCGFCEWLNGGQEGSGEACVIGIDLHTFTFHFLCVTRTPGQCKYLESL